MAKTAIMKFINHHWYLGEETVILSLFDNRVSTKMKHSMTILILETFDEKGIETTTDISKQSTLNHYIISKFLNTYSC